MNEPELSDDEFGRYFEVGMKARALGRSRDKGYKHPIKTMAFRDGWDAAEAGIRNLEDTPESILAKLAGEESK